MFWFLTSVILIFLIYRIFIKPFNYWTKRGVPQYSLWNVWVELITGVMQYRSVADRLRKVHSDFPNTRYYGIYQFFGPTLVVRDPDLIKQITVKDFDHFVDHSNFIPNEGDPLWDNNLFFLRGDEWKSMRAIVSPTFTSSKMKAIFGLISECIQGFVQYFEEQGSETIKMEMRDTFTRLANDVIVKTAFGITCDSLRNRNNEIYLMGKKATHFGEGFWDSIKLYINLIFPFFAKTLRINIINQDVSNFFSNIIKENIQIREKHAIVRPDTINLLLAARRRILNDNKVTKKPEFPLVNQKELPKPQLTDEDIAAQVVLFYLAGFDGVATLMDFIAYEIAINPAIQKRLQREIDEIRINSGDEFKYEDLSKMKYMDMVVSEALRKWPGPILIHRICVKPYTIEPTRKGEKPIHLKEGDVVWLPLFAIHRDPEYYPEPDRFDPERFSEENKSNVNPYVFIPFGVGPRTCLGNRFAVMEAKTVYFNLLSKFDIVTVDNTPIPVKLDPALFQLEVEGGLWLGLKRREKSVPYN